MMPESKSEVRKSWRDVFKIHPATEIFSMLQEDELRKLGEDIKANGLKEPIAMWSLHADMNAQTMVLDGRNRLDAMELVGIETVAPVGKKYWIAIHARFLCLGKTRNFLTLAESTLTRTQFPRTSTADT